MKGSAENLLVNKYPELLLEWDYEKNIGIDLNKVSYSSHKKVWWICQNKHTSYVTINSRTNLSARDKFSNCKECWHDSLRVHDKAELEEYKKNYKPTRNTNDTGDSTEKYVEDLLKSMDFNVLNIGSLAGDSDLVVEVDNIYYYIQVKTLTYKRNESYYMSYNTKYDKDMLIVMVNKERTRFALEFAKNIDVKRLSLIFDYPNSMHKHIMYTNVEIFKIALSRMMLLSCKTFTITNISNKTEFLMLQRFSAYCTNNNINYVNNTVRDTVNGFINNRKLQLSFASLPHTSSTYQIDSNKSAGKFHGKGVTRNFDVGDFDYMIIEVGGIIDDANKYKNNFCIIPSDELIKQEILKTETCKGKAKFHVCSPDHMKPHWSKQYWNNIPKDFL